MYNYSVNRFIETIINRKSINKNLGKRYVGLERDNYSVKKVFKKCME